MSDDLGFCYTETVIRGGMIAVGGRWTRALSGALAVLLVAMSAVGFPARVFATEGAVTGDFATSENDSSTPSSDDSDGSVTDPSDHSQTDTDIPDGEGNTDTPVPDPEINEGDGAGEVTAPAAEKASAEVEAVTLETEQADKEPAADKEAVVKEGAYVVRSALDPQFVLDVALASVNDGANVQLYHANNTLAQRFWVTRHENGTYRIQSVLSGKALDVEGGGTASGTNVQQWTYTAGNLNQSWTLLANEDGSVTFKSRTNGLVLDVCAGEAHNGTNVQMWEANESPAQCFTLEPVDTVVPGVYTLAASSDTSSVVDIASGSQAVGARVQVWSRNDSPAQKFQLEKATDASWFCLRSLCSGLLLTATEDAVTQEEEPEEGPAPTQRWEALMGPWGLMVVNAETGDALSAAGMVSGADMGTAEPGSVSFQSFCLIAVEVLSEGTYMISCAADGRMLDVAGGSFDVGANVQVYSDNGTGAQRWMVEPAGNGYVRLVNAKTRRALDVQGAGAVDETNVHAWISASGNVAQLFRPVPTGDGFYYLESACGGLNVDVAGAGGWDGANVQIYTPNQTAAQKFRFIPAAYTYTTDDVRGGIGTADGWWGVTSFGGYEPSGPVLDALWRAADGVRNVGYDVGFIMIDVKTGQGVACNPDRAFFSASTIKGPYVASLAATNPSRLLRWAGTMELAIRISSNEAYESLRYNFGAGGMWTWCAEAGVDTSMANTWYPHYSARDLVKLWTKNYEFFTGGGNGSWVGSWYQSPLNSMISADLGPYYTTQTKPGWLADYDLAATNDAGIVWAGDRPYLVAILTNAPYQLSILHPIIWAIEDAHKEMVQ
ncbi:RICIN domain-containing protein [Gordonibacter sp.]|nr:RICIN domain-containing protein [Gordonibacter sp.]